MRRTLLVALSLLASSLSAQVTERLDVTITNADLFVTDARGNHVTGLNADEFEVRQDGGLRKITHFAEVSAGGEVARDRAANVVIVFDQTSLDGRDRNVTSEALQKFVTNSLRRQDRLAVASLVPSFRIDLPWTTDRGAAAKTIATASAQPASSLEQQRRFAEQQVRELVDYARSAPDRVPVSFDEAMQTVRSHAAAATSHARARLAAIASAMNLFPPGDHRRVMILVGEGIPPNPGSDLFEHLNTVAIDIESGLGPRRMRDTARAASPLTEASRFSVAEEIRKVAAAAAASGIVLYAINPGQNETSGGRVQSTGPSGGAAEFARAGANRDGYQLLAQPTGGIAFFGMPPDSALEPIARDLTTYYSIGFSAAEPTGSARPITARSRSGYNVRVVKAAGSGVSQASMEAAVLAHHLIAPDVNDLKISLALGPVTFDGQRRKIALRVLIPVDGLMLTPDGATFSGGFTVYVSSGNERGDATAVNRQSHDIRWSAADLPKLRGKKITFALDVAAPPELDTISVGVVDRSSGARGFARVKTSFTAGTI